MSKILITGGAGFVGLHLSKRLADSDDNHITIIDDFSRGHSDDEFAALLARNNVESVPADLTEPDACSGLGDDYDYVYHLAAVIGVENVTRKPDRVLYVNSISTLNILELLKRCSGLKRFLFSSTSEIYAGTLKHFGITIPTDETVNLALEDIASTRTTYALSKMYGESACFNYGAVYNIPFTIARFHNVYGPRMGFAHVIPETFKKIKNGNVIDVPSANHTRAFCYVDDAVEMMIRACEYESTANEIVNIGNSNEEIAIKQLVGKIARVMSKSVDVTELEATPGSPARRCPDVSKIVRLTGYEPSVSLDEGIQKTYDWYQDRLADTG